MGSMNMNGDMWRGSPVSLEGMQYGCDVEVLSNEDMMSTVGSTVWYGGEGIWCHHQLYVSCMYDFFNVLRPRIIVPSAVHDSTSIEIHLRYITTGQD